MRPTPLRVVLTFALLASAACTETEADEEAVSAIPEAPREAEPAITEIPGIDISALRPAAQRTFVRVLNDTLSPCGEPVSVAQCLVDRTSCGGCAIAASYTSRLAAAGHDRREISDLLRLRFGDDTHAEIPSGESPSMGPRDARVVVTVFSDFQCPFCREARPELERIAASFSDRVRLVFKHYPLPMHENARAAALAAAAAHRQGRFWPMHDRLFENQDTLAPAQLLEHARAVGLDLDRFRQDLADPALSAEIDADRELGGTAGVNSTPSVYVNGRAFISPLSSLPAYLTEELLR